MADSQKTKSSRKPCPKGKVRNPETNRCKKVRPPCPKGKVRNPETNRCVAASRLDKKTAKPPKKTQVVTAKPPKKTQAVAEREYVVLAYVKNTIYSKYNDIDERKMTQFNNKMNKESKKAGVMIVSLQTGTDDIKEMYIDAVIKAKSKADVASFLKKVDPLVRVHQLDTAEQFG